MGSEFLNLMPVEEVLRLYSRFRPVERTESVPLLQAVGRVAAEPVVSPEPLPAFPRALMDGYAVRAGDVASARESAPVVLRLRGEIRVGERPAFDLLPGEAARIHTGAMMPAGADAVVMIEHTRAAGDSVEIARAAAVHDHTLLSGEDLARGIQMFSAGRRITPLDVGALAATGISQVRVRARPVVGILSTGDELVDMGQAPGPGQVRDTNAPVLSVQVAAAGGAPVLLPRVRDDEAELEKAVEQARARVDLLLISGGSSVGERDHTAAVLARMGPAGLLVHGIAIAPGKPTLLADIGGIPAFGLPGHPVSSFVVFQVVAAPLLRRLSGETRAPLPRSRKVRLRANLVGSPGRETYVPVRLEEERGVWRATPVLWNSAVFASLLFCDGWVRIPAGKEGFAEGDEAEVELLR